MGICEEKAVEESGDVANGIVTNSNGSLGGWLHKTRYGDKLYPDNEFSLTAMERWVSITTTQYLGSGSMLTKIG